MGKKLEALKNWWKKLGDSMDQGDVVFDTQESALCFESMFTEQKLLQTVKPWKQGCACVTIYKNGKTYCPQYSKTSACPNANCKYNTCNKRHFKAKEQYKIEKEKHEQMLAERAAAWDAIFER